MWTVAQFVAPTAPAMLWAGVAAMSIPIAIHMLSRLRHRPQPWGAMRFLLEAYRRHRARLRIEQLLLLAVRCLILGVLGLSISGPALRGCGARPQWAGSGRLICLVIDDSLSTRALDLEGRSRFERLRRAGQQMVDQLGPDDLVGVWRSAWPVRAPGAGTPALDDPHLPWIAPTRDHVQVREMLARIEPRYSRADTLSALTSVRDVVADHGLQPDRVYVVLLSDWARDAIDLDQPLSAELATFGSTVQLAALTPTPSSDNLQVTGARPRRGVVLAETDGRAIVPMTLNLRRYGADLPAGASQVIVTAHGGVEVLGDPQRRQVTWTAGQATASLGVDVVAPLSDVWSTGSDRSAISLHVHVPGAGHGDVIAADNDRWSVIEVRRQLRVMLVDRFATGAAEDDQAVPPRQWVAMALAPGDVEGPRAVEDDRTVVIETEAAALGAAATEVDAAIVLRPDLVGDVGWRALRELLEAGGLVWLFVPHTGAPALWAPALRGHLGVDWQIGMEVETADESGWALSVGPTAPPVPSPLELLAADWRDLLRPVRVRRRLGVAPGAPGPGSTEVWIATEDERPLLLASQVEGGRLMLFAGAATIEWTNLPTKPLWVPLLHESIRSAAGGAQVLKEGHLRCGDQPVLGSRWRGVESLRLGDVTVSLAAEGGDRVSARPLHAPGVYRAVPESGPILAVNTEAGAGDTGALDEGELSQWFAGAKRWRWLDRDDPASLLAAPVEIVALGWPLLWAVMALVLVESLLARWFSHAQVTSRRSWRQRWLARFRRAA